MRDYSEAIWSEQHEEAFKEVKHSVLKYYYLEEEALYNAMQVNMSLEQRYCKTASRSRLLLDLFHGLRDNVLRLKRNV